MIKKLGVLPLLMRNDIVISFCLSFCHSICAPFCPYNSNYNITMSLSVSSLHTFTVGTNLVFHCVNTSYLPDDSYSPAPAGPAKRKKRRPGFHPRQDRYTTLHSPGGLVPASLARGT